ncbi:MAG: response regulator transcription factor [Clostridiales bacterium]|nr:response regulator transcription factor [Clostridiales bacterium]
MKTVIALQQKRIKVITLGNERILIADDEERIREMIKEYAALESYSFDEASDGNEAIEMFKQNKYSLVILDVMMPKVDGWSVCREIRKSSRVPVIMLTARGEEYDKLFGFELGVDDYIVKPFSPKELMARIKAIIRRSVPLETDEGKGEQISIEGFKIEFEARNVTVDGKQVSLTPKEYELLSFLVRNPKKVFSRDQLLSSVWGFDYFGDDRTVDTHVKMLRERLGDYRRFIVTVWGTGYKWEVT